MPKPCVPRGKKTVYGTRQPRISPASYMEWQPTQRACVICKAKKTDEWHELMEEGWVCQSCRPKGTPLPMEEFQESQIETHRPERDS